MFHGDFVTPAYRRQARTTKIDNPLCPPLVKGGWGGFESYFLCRSLKLDFEYKNIK